MAIEKVVRASTFDGDLKAEVRVRSHAVPSEAILIEGDCVMSWQDFKNFAGEIDEVMKERIHDTE
jgi:hypothetical protein